MGVNVDEFDTVWAPPGKAVDDSGSTYAKLSNAVANATDTVLVGPGTFTGDFDADTQDLNIIGTGPGTVVDLTGSAGTDAIDITASGVTLEQMTVKAASDANCIHVTAADATVKNIVIEGGDRGVFIDAGGDDATVENITVKSASTTGVEMDGDRCLAETIRIRSAAGVTYGIRSSGADTRINGGFILDGSTTRVQMDGDDSAVQDLTIDAGDQTGLTLTGADQLVVGNTIYGNDGSTLIDDSAATRPELHGNIPPNANNAYTDRDAQDAIGEAVGGGLSYDASTGEVAFDVVASGSTTLSSGAATVDTGISQDATLTVLPAIGPDTDDADIACEVRANSGGNYVVDIVETQDTSVGNPTVNYDIVAVRRTAGSGTTESMWIDTFDDQDLTEYSGDTGSFSFSTTADQGTHSLTSTNSDVAVTSTTGLDNYPAKGDKWEVEVRATDVDSAGEVQQQLWFGFADSNNFYYLDLQWDISKMSLKKLDGGVSADIDGQQLDVSPDTWHTLRFTWDDGTLGGNDNDITVEALDENNNVLGTVFTNDATHAANTGIGWRATTDETGSQVFFDAAELI